MALRLCASKFQGYLVNLSRYNAKASLQRNASTEIHDAGIDEKVVVTDDGSTIVCWHPEKPFPYECSRPLPAAVEESDGVLKVKKVSNAILSKQSDELVRRELMRITHTTKHRWFPRSRDKYRIKFERNREYL